MKDALDRVTGGPRSSSWGETAKTLRLRSGELVVTDGPFAETKEVLSGFYLVDADSEERALELAQQIPTLSRMGGGIEVRPIVER